MEVVTMANEENLINLRDRTPEERKEIARKGAEATNKLLKERKTLKEELLLLLSQDNFQERISLALLEKATTGDTKAFEVIRDTVGEKPVDKLEADVGVTNINIKLDDDE
jgi:hypothetical protein